jgi:oligopeptide transport system substrate-binding protein
LTIELRYNTSETHKKVAIAIAAMLRKALGIDTQLFNDEYKVFLEERTEKKVTQFFRAAWTADYVDPYSFAELLLSDSGLNDFGYNNPDYDRLVKQAGVTVDPEERMRLLEQAEALVVKDVPLVPIYSYVKKAMAKPYVEGYEPNVVVYWYDKDVYLLKH